MAGTALAEISDLSARGVDTTDAPRVQAAIDDASNSIHVATDDAWVDSTTGELVASVPGIATTICCRVAMRILDNPRGVTDRSESLGSWSRRESFADDGAQTFLNRGEVDELRAAAGFTGGLATVVTTRGDLETPWVHDDEWHEATSS